MFRGHRLFSYALLILLSAVVLACGSSQPPAEEAAKPAEPLAPVVDVAKHMHEHMGRLDAMQDAVIRGDLDAVVEPATWIANHDAAPMPASIGGYVPDMKKTAGMAAAAKDLTSAATATAQLVAACGACHQASGKTIAWSDAPKPADGTGIAAHMLEHQWALDLMHKGLAMPSDEAWKAGVAALKVSPMAAKELPKDEKLTKEVVAFEKKIHELATKAETAPDLGSKVAVYSETLVSCASCHGLHGKVWGPGIAK